MSHRTRDTWICAIVPIELVPVRSYAMLALNGSTSTPIGRSSDSWQNTSASSGRSRCSSTAALHTWRAGMARRAVVRGEGLTRI